MRRKRKLGDSSALSFMDVICCGFGAVILLFIITSKQQTDSIDSDRENISETLSELVAMVSREEQRIAELDASLALRSAAGSAPANESTSELAARQQRLARQLEDVAETLRSMELALEQLDGPAALNRPTADARYLSGLRLDGPRVLIALTNSGSMLGRNSEEAIAALRAGPGQRSDKWERAKEIVRTVLASIPRGTQVALWQMNTDAAPIYRSASDPWFDPYDEGELLAALTALASLEAQGGHDLAKAFFNINQIPTAPSSILLITDGLPTAPAAGAQLTEADRVDLFRRALTVLPNVRTSVLLLPFAGDPAAAGLYWRISSRTRGVTIVPDPQWPPR